MNDLFDYLSVIIQFIPYGRKIFRPDPISHPAELEPEILLQSKSFHNNFINFAE